MLGVLVGTYLATRKDWSWGGAALAGIGVDLAAGLLVSGTAVALRARGLRGVQSSNAAPLSGWERAWGGWRYTCIPGRECNTLRQWTAAPAPDPLHPYAGTVNPYSPPVPEAMALQSPGGFVMGRAVKGGR